MTPYCTDRQVTRRGTDTDTTPFYGLTCIKQYVLVDIVPWWCGVGYMTKVHAAQASGAYTSRYLCPTQHFFRPLPPSPPLPVPLILLYPTMVWYTHPVPCCTE